MYGFSQRGTFLGKQFGEKTSLRPPHPLASVYHTSELIHKQFTLQPRRPIGNPPPQHLASSVAGVIQGSATNHAPLEHPMPHPPMGLSPTDFVPVRKGNEDEGPAHNLRKKYLKKGQFGWVHGDLDKYMYVAHIITKQFIPQLTGKLGLTNPSFDVTNMVMNAIHDGGLVFNTFDVIATNLIVGLLHSKYGEHAHIDPKHPAITKLVKDVSLRMWKAVKGKGGGQSGSGPSTTDIGKQINAIGHIVTPLKGSTPSSSDMYAYMDEDDNYSNHY